MAENLDQFLDNYVGKGAFPFLMASIIHKNKEIYSHITSAVQDIPSPKRDSIFRIYSMTKPITTVAILILASKGLLSVSDNLYKYIPSFEHMKVFVSGDADNPVLEDTHSPITIHQLLTHTSGLTYGIFGVHPCDKLVAKHVGPENVPNWFRNLTLEELCDRFAKAPLLYQPGTAFHYSISSDILGRVVEVVSGMSLKEFFQVHIFDPLEMHDTSFVVPEEKWPRLLDCYEYTGPLTFKESVNEERDRRHGGALLAGGGGLVSTMDDYLKFAKFLLRKCKVKEDDDSPLIPETLFTMMTSNQLPNQSDLVHFSFDRAFSETLGEGIGFGYGVSVIIDPSIARGCSNSSMGEFGWGGVASTWFSIDPVNECGCILMTQLIPSSVYPIRSEIRSLYHDVVDKYLNE